MKDSSKELAQIRVRTSKYHKQLYKDLTNKDNCFGDAHVVFFIAACIGYATKKRKPLGKDADERFWGHTITSQEKVVYQSIYLNDNNLDITLIQNDEKLIRHIEEYANGGLHHIIQEMSIFFDNIEGECTLKENEAANLPSRLLSQIIQLIE